MLDAIVPNVNERERIPMEAIESVAHRITEKFNPEKIILFGSYAYGIPKPWSDVDLLVVMETPDGPLAQMLAISRALSPHPFGIDILVSSPDELARRTASNDSFIKEVTSRGKVLYEKRHGRVS